MRLATGEEYIMDQYKSQCDRSAFLKHAFNGVALRLTDDSAIPCCVIYPMPCLNKATLILAYFDVDRHWRFDAPMCRICARSVAALYEEKP